jgi:tRNA U55 pseudouridine synthase TruB
MRQRMCIDHTGKSNYLRMLIQLLGKLNSLAKEIKKINKFKSANLNKRQAVTSQDVRRRNQSPTRSPLRQNCTSETVQHAPNKKSTEEELAARYEEALKLELQYRLNLAIFNNDERVKENVRQFNLKKVISEL